MKITKKIVALILAIMMLFSVASVTAFGAESDDVNANEYRDAAMALDDEYAYNGQLGAIYSPARTVFKVWAPTATKVELNLYATGSDEEEGASSLGTHKMSKLIENDKFTGVWQVIIEGDLLNVYYTYSVTSPAKIIGGKETTRETQDVYTYASGVNSKRSMVVNLDATDPEGWENDRHVFVDEQSDAVVWELQVKDFSYNENSGVSKANRGKYLAFTETGTTVNNEGNVSTCVDYLKQLGVTHVQINPFYDFGSIDEAGDDSQFNWGYDPVNYGVPEGSFSSNPYDGNVRIKECKQMIKALHDAGIGVIMDVVYNHTYATDSCFNRTVPHYYYRMNANGTYSNQSGCSNDTASERYMFRKYMLDMIQYWVNEYHIDGYRFDLMGIHDVETMNLIREMLDQTDTRIIMYGEGWSGNTLFDPESCTGTKVEACTQRNAPLVSDRIGFFNDQMRDALKGGVFDGPTAPGFLSGSVVFSPGVSYGVKANTYGKGCNWDAKNPQQCVSYASCHDNNTLYDKLVGINHGSSADYRARYSDAIAQNKLSSAITLSSQGISLMLAGEEMARSKDGDENSYKSSATLNMIDWSSLEKNADLVSYYKGMLEIRKAFSPFTAATADHEDTTYNYYFTTSMAKASKTIAYTVENTKEGEWNKVAVIFNGSKGKVTQTLKSTVDKGLTEDMEWVIIADDKSAGTKKLGEVKGLTFTVPASSAIIAVEKSTYEACAEESEFSTITIEHIDNTTGQSLATSSIIGRVGEGYAVHPDESISIKYELSSVEGDTVGVFGENDAKITYKYDLFVPSSFKNGDVDEDGDLTILDATAVQLHLLGAKEYDKISRGDYNYTGEIDILDATLLQLYLLGSDVAVYDLTVNYLADNGNTISSPVVREVRLGDTYTTQPIDNVFYVPDAAPENATGVVTGNITVDYTYKYTADMITAHIKHDGDLTWNPFLWVWADNIDKTKSVNCFDAWPGVEIEEKDENGWYTIEFGVPVDYVYSLIVNNGGSVQTENYTDLSSREIWIVIDDEAAVATGPWISIYDDPELTNKIA